MRHVSHESLERNLAAKIEATELKLENKLAVMAGDRSLQKWMLGTLIAINVAVLVKLFIQQARTQSGIHAGSC